MARSRRDYLALLGRLERIEVRRVLPRQKHPVQAHVRYQDMPTEHMMKSDFDVCVKYA
jgi:hypothetical protein